MWLQRYSYPNGLAVARSEEPQLQPLADKLPVCVPHRLRCDFAGGARALRSNRAFGLHFLPRRPHSCPTLRLSGIVVCCPAHRKTRWRRSVGLRETILFVLSVEPTASRGRFSLLTHSRKRQRLGTPPSPSFQGNPVFVVPPSPVGPGGSFLRLARGLAQSPGQFVARKPVGSPGVHDHHCRRASSAAEEEKDQ
jgi:hypothetical protein